MQNLIEQTLGEFDLIATARVYPRRHAEPAQIARTETHELAHREMICTTTFGILQSLLARAAKGLVSSDGASTPLVLREAKQMLRATIGASWFAHEGYAVFIEDATAEQVGSRFGPKPTRPLNYERAAEPIFAFARTLPEWLAPFRTQVVTVVLGIAFNTSALNDLAFANHSHTWLASHLSDLQNCPDFRYRSILEQLTNNGLPSTVLHSLKSLIASLSHSYGVALTNDPLAWAVEPGTHGQIMESVIDGFSSVLEAHVSEMPDAPFFLRSQQVAQRLPQFHDGARAFLQQHGLQCPPLEYVAPDDPRRNIHASQVEYVTDSAYVETYEQPRDVHRLVDSLLASSDSFVMCLSRRDNPYKPQIEGNNLYFVSVYPFAFRRLSKDAGDGPTEATLTEEHLREARAASTHRLHTLFGPRAVVGYACLKLLPKTLAVTVHADAIDWDKHAFCDGVDVWAKCKLQEPIVVFPTTDASMIMTLFTDMLRVQGVDCMVQLGDQVDRLRYMVLLRRNRISYMVKITSAVAGLLGDSRIGLSSWLSSLQPTEDQLQEFKDEILTARLLRIMDYDGAFSPKRS